MRKGHYIVDPDESLAERCDSAGQFLRDDYLRAMSDSKVGLLYNKPQSYKRIVIVGAHTVPMVTTRSVWIALQTNPDTITVKVPDKAGALQISPDWLYGQR